MADFQRGDQIEVIGSDDGFLGSFFSATVISRLNSGHFIVQYNTLLNDAVSRPLREIISVVNLRPIPPPLRAESYKVGEAVDAYENEGWWTGEVTRRSRGRGGMYYDVYFEMSGEESRYHVSQLRVHQDWVNGRWKVYGL